MNIRRRNLEGLLETGLIIQKSTYDTDGTEHSGFYTNENILPFPEEEVDELKLLQLVETMAAGMNIVFSFTFLPEEEYPWTGGIKNWRDPIEFPKDEEAAEKLKGTAIRKFQERWLPDAADIPVFDRSFPDLMCQLLIALMELFDNPFVLKET